MYSIDNNRLANEKSILSNTNDRDHDQEFYQGKIVPLPWMIVGSVHFSSPSVLLFSKLRFRSKRGGTVPV